MRALALEVLSAVVNGVDFRGIRVDASLEIPDDGVFFPAAFPELVGHLEVFVGSGVAVAVIRESAKTEARPRIGQIGGHDVPGHPAFRKMIQGGDLPGEGEGRRLEDGARESEAQVLGHRGHRWDQQGWIVHRHLHAFANRSFRSSPIGVVQTHDVGEKQSVEAAALQDLRELEPGLQAVVFELAGFRTGPEALLNVRDTIHREAVQEDSLLFAHFELLTGEVPGGMIAVRNRIPWRGFQGEGARLDMSVEAGPVRHKR